MIAGVAVAGASLFAMNAPTATGPLVQQQDVKLAAGEVDWTTFLANVNDNLATLQSRRRHVEHRTVDGARQRLRRLQHPDQQRSDRL